MLIDVHSHILPGIDDGAQDVTVTRSLLEQLAAQGVTVVVATPHFYAHREQLDRFLERRQAAIERMLTIPGMKEATNESALAIYESQAGPMHIYLGAEAALSPALLRHDSLDRLCIGQNRHILIEMPFTKEWDQPIYQLIDQLIYQFDLKPIIAHIERYPATNYGKLLDAIQPLADLSCLIQMNVDSLQDRRIRNNCKKLVRGNWIDLIGSDCHNMDRRPPHFDLLHTLANKWGIDFTADFRIDFT